MRNGMAEKAAADVSLIQNSARQFFIQNPAYSGRWPGETWINNCNMNPVNFTAELANGGYLRTAQPPNAPAWCKGAPNQPPPNDPMCSPWYESYDISVYAPPAAATPACLLAVSTFVPTSVANAFISFLPQATCGAGCPNPSGTTPPAGFTRCCSFATKPGAAIAAECGTRPVIRDATGALKCQPLSQQNR
jgi:hypothetical protein